MNVKTHENGYITYTADLIPKYSGVHYYYFSYTSNGVRHYASSVAMPAMVCWIRAKGFQLTVYNGPSDTAVSQRRRDVSDLPDRFCSSGKVHDNVPV